MRSLLLTTKPAPLEAPRAQDSLSLLRWTCNPPIPILLTLSNGELEQAQGRFFQLPYFILYPRVKPKASKGKGEPEAESGPRADSPSPGWSCSPQATSTCLAVCQDQAGGVASALEAEGRWGPYPDTPREGHGCRQLDKTRLCMATARRALQLP